MSRYSSLAIVAGATLAMLIWLVQPSASQHRLEIVDVEGQPLAANVERLLKALDFLGHPLPSATVQALQRAIRDRDARRIQELLDPHVLIEVNINPESRVKAKRGPAEAILQQGGYVPIIIKVINESTVTQTVADIQSASRSDILGGSRGQSASRSATVPRCRDVYPATHDAQSERVESGIRPGFDSQQRIREA
jgi:hypothetical protein